MEPRFFDNDMEQLHEVINWSLQCIAAGRDPRSGPRPADDLDADLADSVSPDGIGPTEALRRFTDVIVPATRDQGNGMNLAYIPSAATPASLVFDLAVSAAQMFAGTWEAGAGAIHAENQALRWLADLAGWPDGAGGTFVSGGTVGNLSALTTARQRARDRVGVEPERWAIAATGEAHSSVRAAARTLNCDIVDVRGDDVGRMTGASLAEALNHGNHPTVFATVATAGTTNAGIVDGLSGIADVCAQHELWLHVDGAYGLAAMAAASARPKFDGIEKADSFVVDPHKWLFAPFDCCALVYREPHWAAAAHSQFAGYLEQVDRNEWNPADYAIQLSRRARGLPFWFSLATHGTDQYAAAVERGLATTIAVASGISDSPYLELVLEPELGVILFRRLGWSEARLLEWSNEQARLGSILCLPTRWHNESVLRLCIVNPDTDAARVLDTLETMR